MSSIISHQVVAPIECHSNPRWFLRLIVVPIEGRSSLKYLPSFHTSMAARIEINHTP